MPRDTQILITQDFGLPHGATFRIDCSHCGLVDKAWSHDVLTRANIHNQYAHNNIAQVVMPATLV